MRRKDKELKDKEIIGQIITNSHICRIAFSNDNIPYIVPVNYGYYKNQLFIHSAKAGKKIDLIRKSPEICFEIENGVELVKGEKACDWTTKYRSVIGFGRISILESINEKIKGLDIVMAQHGKTDKSDYSEALLDNMVILKIDIREMTAKQSEDWE